jgi:hypothetical protein
MGPSKLAEELQKRGYDVEVRGAFVILNNYEVLVGRFAGQTIKLAFQTPPDYDITPPGGFHTSPQIVPPGTNNVNPSELGPDFCYWSRPIHEWARARGVARLLSNVNAVLQGA